MSVVLARIGARIDAIPTVEIQKFSTDDYDHPLAGGYHLPRIMSVQQVRLSMFSSGTTYGQTNTTDGEIRLANLDGRLDVLGTYGYNESSELLVGEVDQEPAAMTVVFRGTTNAVSRGLEDVRLQLTTRSRELVKPASPAKYAGTNSGSTGLEGLDTDLKGKNKIRLFGKRALFRPHLLNRPAQTYGINHDTTGARSAVTSIDRVTIDTGATGYADWTFGTNYASAALLAASSPSIGIYNTCLAEGLIKMGGSLTTEQLDRVLVTATEGSTSDDRTVAGIIKRLLLDAGVSSGDIVSSSYTTLLAANSAATGIAVDDDRTYPTVIDEIAGYGGVFWGANQLNQYEFGRIEDPSSGSSVATLRHFDLDTAGGVNDFNILSIAPVANRDGGPVWKITATDRTEVTSDSAVLNQFPARQIDFNIYFFSSPDVQAELDRRLNLYKVLRETFEVEVKLSPAIAAAIKIGSVVTVYHSRFGFSAGKKALVTEIEPMIKPEPALKFVIWS